MDCRRTLLVVLGLLVGLAGCTRNRTLPLASEGGPGTSITQGIEWPDKDPAASSWVAFGRFCEQEAAQPHRQPADRQPLLDQARRAYQQALELEPKNLSALGALARLYVTMGNEDQAIATYHKAVKGHPKEPVLWYELGMCQCRKKEWEEALKSLAKGWELDPEDRQLATAYGYCLARTGRYDESLDCFRKAYGEAKAHYTLARTLHHLQQPQLCRQHLVVALQINPALTEAKELLLQVSGSHSEAAPDRPALAPMESIPHLQRIN